MQNIVHPSDKKVPNRVYLSAVAISAEVTHEGLIIYDNEEEKYDKTRNQGIRA